MLWLVSSQDRAETSGRASIIHHIIKNGALPAKLMIRTQPLEGNIHQTIV